jgi:ribosomal protein S4
MTDYLMKTERRLVDYLMDIGYTRTKVKQLMRHRAVEVNGKALRDFDHLLHKGDTLSVRKDKSESTVAHCYRKAGRPADYCLSGRKEKDCLLPVE